MRTPLLVLAFLLAAAPFPRAEPRPSPAPPGAEEPSLPAPQAAAAETRIEISEAMSARLKAAGWRAADDGSVERLEGAAQGRVPRPLLEHADLKWKDGALVYDKSLTEVEDAQLGPVLEGLAYFASVAALERRQVGRALADGGVPPSFDGRKLINPDGTATYFGVMLHHALERTPGARQRLSGERLSQALGLFGSAYDQAFGGKQAPDIALTDVKQAWSLLAARVRPGETALSLRPYGDLGDALRGHLDALTAERDAAVAAGDAPRRADAEKALAALAELDARRYHAGMRLPLEPRRPPPPAGEAGPEAESPPVSLSGTLPTVLRVLDRINGRPLTPAQQESLIKSFPGGELVWRLGVQELWREGLTGKGVKVAVIDGGIAPHPELDDAVRARRNFTAQRGAGIVDDHGTHVAGIVRMIAPEAEIRGYAALPADDANPRLERPHDPDIVRAIEAAVADGNRVINLSLGGGRSPSDEVARAIERYAGQGVIFVVSAGNEGDDGGVNAPSVARNALSVGNLDVNGRPAVSSSYGRNFDADRIAHVAKTLFMLPGTNIVAPVPGDGFATKTGTSMAAPGLSAVSVLLYQAVTSFTPAPDPVTASARVRDALYAGAQPLSVDRLPADHPLDQDVVVVNPLAAYQALSNPVAAR